MNDLVVVQESSQPAVSVPEAPAVVLVPLDEGVQEACTVIDTILRAPRTDDPAQWPTLCQNWARVHTELARYARENDTLIRAVDIANDECDRERARAEAAKADLESVRTQTRAASVAVQERIDALLLAGRAAQEQVSALEHGARGLLGVLGVEVKEAEPGDGTVRNGPLSLGYVEGAVRALVSTVSRTRADVVRERKRADESESAAAAGAELLAQATEAANDARARADESDRAVAEAARTVAAHDEAARQQAEAAVETDALWRRQYENLSSEYTGVRGRIVEVAESAAAILGNAGIEPDVPTVDETAAVEAIGAVAPVVSVARALRALNGALANKGAESTEVVPVSTSSRALIEALETGSVPADLAPVKECVVGLAHENVRLRAANMDCMVHFGQVEADLRDAVGRVQDAPFARVRRVGADMWIEGLEPKDALALDGKPVAVVVLQSQDLARG